ncbi:restriction endonuclease subunit S [Brumicola pallidula]|uniref:Type I restriction enzyme, S subunit n=1 Tax=Brumicola pallidula DSM 14239 = ACAM 615 TaxID=1121922 RepID=K6YV84_9ALTE|nr:restriction endonuclease subunit S [Glaciecola pallidula]GAC27876.1 type I restriction enzyme, S subunit [Glaciecola pallidula DSM 14239 = ACAM 615]
MAKLAKISKYESYNDSGIDWLGDIPVNWELSKFKFCFTSSNAGEVIDKSHWDHGDELLYTCKRTPFKSSYKGFSLKRKTTNNDLLLTRNGTPYVHYPSEGSIYSNVVQRVSIKQELDRKFCWYALSNSAQYLGGYGDIIESFNMSTWNELYVAIPDIESQLDICKFLDKKTAQLDEAIVIKQKQIDLLKERKQIIIQQAVTQGLTPDPLMKDAGVDWIGEVPEHWEITRFKNIFFQSRLPVRQGDGVVTSFRDGQVTLRSNRRLTGFTEAIIEGGYQGIRKGQLVLNSMDAFEGAIGVSDSDGKCTPEYVICDPKTEGVSQYYFAYLLREMALAKYIQVICNAVRQRAVRIRFNNLASRFMVIPPLQEQNEIVQHIQSESKKIDAGVTHLQSQIDKFKEYKATLINSAVTGKIKVI